MQTVLFTKLFREQRLEEIRDIVQELGFDGIDFLIRTGYHVEPESPEGIGLAVKMLKQTGLAVPMATTDMTDPAALPAERLLKECVDAGIGVVRLGYWQYQPETGYRAGFQKVRRDLDALEQLARTAGIKLAIQLHGGTIHCSGSLTAALLEGHDPKYLAAYADPGNQAVQDGREDWRITFDILQSWLCCVGVKNGGWFPTKHIQDGQRLWESDWVGIADGMVPWKAILAYLSAGKYDGLLSFHSHYQLPLPQALDQTRVDLQFVLRQLHAHEEPRATLQ